MLTSQILNEVKPKIRAILNKALEGKMINSYEALQLLQVTGKELLGLQYTANQLCLEKKKNIVTFVINRNINFTNICQKECKFCSFNVPKDSKDAFCFSIEDFSDKIIEAIKYDCSELCIQGGINPDLNADFYFDLLKTVKKIAPYMHIHAFSPQEVFHISELIGDSIENTLIELKKLGLGSMPGTAAEILVDEVRKIICPNKITTAQWIEIITTAHYVGIPTTATMMYGHIEDLQNRVEHLEILRNIQSETNGFTEFVPLLFMRDNPILSRLDDYPLKQYNNGIDDLRLYAVSRLFFNGFIDNIQCSWVKLGPKLAQISLNYGVNDFSGTLMEENISKSAGAKYGEYLPPEDIIDIIRKAGKEPAQRDTTYNVIKMV